MAADKPVRVTLLGDEKVGKTSLITAAATESFPEAPPPVLPPTRLPAEATPENVPIILTDTSSKPEDRQVTQMPNPYCPNLRSTHTALLALQADLHLSSHCL